MKKLERDKLFESDKVSSLHSETGELCKHYTILLNLKSGNVGKFCTEHLESTDCLGNEEKCPYKSEIEEISIKVQFIEDDLLNGYKPLLLGC